MSGFADCAVRIVKVMPQSIWATHGRDHREVNIPRRLIHEADRAGLDALLPGTLVAMRIEDWKARELGLETVRDETAAAGDLFEGSTP